MYVPSVGLANENTEIKVNLQVSKEITSLKDFLKLYPDSTKSIVQEDYPSGKWSGYYSYSPLGDNHEAPDYDQHEMNYYLEFDGDTLRANGKDDVGEFELNGGVDKTSFQVKFLKHYIGQHTVDYNGSYDTKLHHIWGQWNIGDNYSGGFKLRFQKQ